MFYAGDVSLPLGGTSHYEGRGKEEVFLGHFDLTDGHAEEKKENETLEERRERKEKDREERKINKQGSSPDLQASLHKYIAHYQQTEYFIEGRFNDL